jgi:hypothetical protein
MNVTKAGWLQEYIEFRKSLLRDYQADKKKVSHPEQALYRIIQPTGLMYGQAANVLDHPESNQWSDKDKLKILLAESLIGSSILFYDKPIQDESELSVIVRQTIESIGNFYTHVFPELATAGKTWYGKKKSPMEVVEQILEKRIERSAAQASNFWLNFFNTSLLFLDIYIFGQWIHTKGDKIVSDFFVYQKQELRFSVVKVIASAAHANHTVEFEERKLMDYFLQSAGLSSEKKREAKEIFETGMEVEALDLPTNNSWILKKYFLEMAILTIWSDKLVEDLELSFLNRLSKHLSLPPDELDNSRIALEGFILQHWGELENLQSKHSLQQVGDQFMERVAQVVEVNRAKLIREAKGNTEMISLLRKAQSGELSLEEKLQMRDWILTILKTIPNFAIVSLPQRFLTLPVLMKILPKEFFTEVAS